MRPGSPQKEKKKWPLNHLMKFEEIIFLPAFSEAI